MKLAPQTMMCAIFGAVIFVALSFEMQDDLNSKIASTSPAAYSANRRISSVKTQPADFCQLPYEAVCQNPVTSTEATAARIKEVRASIEQQALRDTAKALGKDPDTFTRAMLDALGSVTQQKFQENVENEEDLYLTKSAAASMTPFTKDLRENFQRAIQSCALTNDQKKRSAKIIEQLDLYTSFQFTTWRGSDHYQPKDYDDDLGFDIATMCGEDGSLGANRSLQEQAFAEIHRNNDQKDIGDGAALMCSGIFMGAEGKGLPPTDVVPSLFFIASHEMGHFLGNNWEPEFYSHLSSCLQKNYPGPADAEGSTQGDWYKAHLDEITADYWAIQSVGQYFKKQGKTLSFAQKLDFLQHSTGFLCDVPGDAIHPNGKYRLQFLLSDPEMRRQMGCLTSPATAPITSTLGGRPACTLKGEE